MQGLLHEVRLISRTLLRSPAFLVASLGSLALAVGASATAFSVIDAVRFRALPFANADRLVLFSEVPADDGAARAGPASVGAGTVCRSACDVSYTSWDQVLQRYPFRSLDAVAAYTSGGKALNLGGDPILVTGGVVSPGLFGLLGVRPLLGRSFDAEDNRVGATPVTLLSHELWTTYFARDPRMIGRTVKLSDTQYTVIGVMPPGFRHEVNSQFWLSAVPTLDPSTRPSIRTVTAIGRLAPGRTLAQLQSELTTVEPAPPAAGVPRTVPMRLSAEPLRARYAESTRSHDVIFGAIVACILLIACANLANLILVRALHQQREFAVRSALGAGTARLTRLLLSQHLVIVAAGAALGLLLARWSLGVLGTLSVLDSLRPAGMEYRIDFRVVLFTSALAAALAVLLSVIPARIVGRSAVHVLLREGAPTSVGAGWGRVAQQLFVVAQIAMAAMLVVGASLMTRTVLRLSHVPLGFDAAHLLQGTPSFPHVWRVKEKYLPLSRQILAELGQIPGVSSVALRARVPLGDPRSPRLTIDGAATPLAGGAAPGGALAVSDGYFATLGVPLIGGREFTSTDRENGLPVAIVNEWAARRWWPGGSQTVGGAPDVLGRSVRVDTAAGLGITFTVVGVARDNKAAQPNILLAEDGPELYVPWEQISSAFPGFVVRSSVAPAALLKPLRLTLARLVPDRPLFASLIAADVDDQLRGVRVNALQIAGFATVGLFLALLGIHGVLSYAVGRRSRELGIRGALGATRWRIRRLVLLDAARLTGVGLAVGLPAAAVAARLIDELLHGTNRLDPLVYGAVAVGVTLVALLASYIPARRASRVDPMVVLRSG